MTGETIGLFICGSLVLCGDEQASTGTCRFEVDQDGLSLIEYQLLLVRRERTSNNN
jgi:hypothetical protein